GPHQRTIRPAARPLEDDTTMQPMSDELLELGRAGSEELRAGVGQSAADPGSGQTAAGNHAALNHHDPQPGRDETTSGQQTGDPGSNHEHISFDRSSHARLRLALPDDVKRQNGTKD